MSMLRYCTMSTLISFFIHIEAQSHRWLQVVVPHSPQSGLQTTAEITRFESRVCWPTMGIRTTMSGREASPLETCTNGPKQPVHGHWGTTGMCPMKRHSVVATHSMLVVLLHHRIMAITGIHLSPAQPWIHRMHTHHRPGDSESASSTQVKHSLGTGMTLMCGMGIHGKESQQLSPLLWTQISTMGAVGSSMSIR